MVFAQEREEEEEEEREKEGVDFWDGISLLCFVYLKNALCAYIDLRSGEVDSELEVIFVSFCFIFWK